MDRHLDTWIAENLFNWDPLHWQGHDIETLDPELCPSYTSDMNDALEVMAKYDGFYLESWLTEEGSLAWCASIDQYGGSTIYHENPCMAICMVAYKKETGKNWPLG